MKKKSKKTAASRRSFLENGIVGGTALALGFSAGKLIEANKNETVKMITASGKLVEIPKKFLPEKKGKKLSNNELKRWMDKGENDPS
jgi:hypothetical protein